MQQDRRIEAAAVGDDIGSRTWESPQQSGEDAVGIALAAERRLRGRSRVRGSLENRWVTQEVQVARAAGAVPNAVDAELMERMKAHWSEEAIVQILGAVCLYGFLNRFNDSLATPLEEGSAAFAEEAIGAQGWTRGKHA